VGTVKEEAKKILDGLPDEASWEDLMYRLYVRKKIADGVRDADEGRLIPHDEVKRRLLGA
jgi:predicted transcriptional regulator